MGWYGARLVTMDFLKRAVLNDILFSFGPRIWCRTSTHRWSPLARLAIPPCSHHRHRATCWSSDPYLPLITTGRTVEVTLTGATTANQASWRFTLVAVDKAGVPHYAPLAAVTGTGSATVTMTPPTGARLFPHRHRTPYVYESLGLQATASRRSAPVFPYRLRINDAVPAPGSVEACQSVSLAVRAPAFLMPITSRVFRRYGR